MPDLMMHSFRWLTTSVPCVWPWLARDSPRRRGLVGQAIGPLRRSQRYVQILDQIPPVPAGPARLHLAYRCVLCGLRSMEKSNSRPGRHASRLQQGGASVATRAICCVTIGSKPGLTRTAGSWSCSRPRLAAGLLSSHDGLPISLVPQIPGLNLVMKHDCVRCTLQDILLFAARDPGRRHHTRGTEFARHRVVCVGPQHAMA